MIDGHIHIERGDYTLEWIQQFVDRAVATGLDEIRLLEHNYMFKEFEPMYDTVRANSDFVNDWFVRKAGKKDYKEYLDLIDKVRANQYPVSIKSSCNIYILFAPCNFSKNPFYYLRLFRYYLNLSESVSAFGDGKFICAFTVTVAVHQMIRNFACRKPLFISPFYIFRN